MRILPCRFPQPVNHPVMACRAIGISLAVVAGVSLIGAGTELAEEFCQLLIVHGADAVGVGPQWHKI